MKTVVCLGIDGFSCQEADEIELGAQLGQSSYAILKNVKWTEKGEAV